MRIESAVIRRGETGVAASVAAATWLRRAVNGSGGVSPTSVMLKGAWTTVVGIRRVGGQRGMIERAAKGALAANDERDTGTAMATQAGERAQRQLPWVDEFSEHRTDGRW